MTTAIAIIALVFAGSSAIISIIVWRMNRHTNLAAVMFRLYDTIESSEYRPLRRIIYELDRSKPREWHREQREAALRWIANLDLIASVATDEQIDPRALLFMYGDVILRIVYQLAPFCNWQGEMQQRGPQFALPLRLWVIELVDTWRRCASHGIYPERIGFSSQPLVELVPGVFQHDPELSRFLTGARFAKPS